MPTHDELITWLREEIWSDETAQQESTAMFQYTSGIPQAVPYEPKKSLRTEDSKGLSTCQGTCQNQRSECKHYMPASLSPRCTFFIFDEYCDWTEEKAAGIERWTERMKVKNAKS